MATSRTTSAPESVTSSGRTFLLVWLTQSFSIVGSFVTYFAIVLWLSAYRFPDPDQSADLAFALAALTIALALPALIGSPFIGVWVDRADRRRLMIGANLANAVVGAILATVAGPIVTWLQGHRIPRPAGAAIVLLGLVALGVLVLALVLGGIVEQSDQIKAAASNGLDKIESWFNDTGANGTSGTKM